jgi:hypothetical protein
MCTISNPILRMALECFMHVQAYHLDLDLYDHYFKPRGYLTFHKEHMKKDDTRDS